MSERWKSVGDDFASLKDAFKDRYDATDDEAPDSEEVKSALSTIGDGLERLFSSIGGVVRDDEFKSKAKTTMKNLADAISESVSDISDKATHRKSDTSSEAASSAAGEAPSDTPEAAADGAADAATDAAADAADDVDVDTLREDLDGDM